MKIEVDVLRPHPQPHYILVKHMNPRQRTNLLPKNQRRDTKKAVAVGLGSVSESPVSVEPVSEKRSTENLARQTKLNPE